MTVSLPIREAAAAAGWREHLAALALATSAILLLFAGDVADMARIWWESPTFNHCLLVLPIIGWLVAQRAPELRRLAPQVWTPGFGIVGAGALLWLLGEAGGVAIARQLALLILLQGAVLTLLGAAVARGLAFPLFYAFFLVPAGEELVAPMQVLTAHMSMGLLAWFGVPAHLEGIFITIPNGYFEVAEACSGVRFLIAMAALGALVANVCFRSWGRRLAFAAAAILIPIIANGIRAWGTIYIAHLTTADFAEGFDHVVYGWIFFAVVIALLLGVGWRFFDRRPDEPWFDPADLQQPGTRPASRPLLGAALTALLATAALPLAWSGALAREAAPIASFSLPELPGWTKVEPTGRPWQPRFKGADQVRVTRYRDSMGRKVDLAVAVFARQEDGRELVSFGQGSAEGWAWSASGAAPAGGRLDRFESHRVVRDVATFYLVGDKLTGSRAEAKIATMKARLLGGPQRAVAVLVSSTAPAPRVSPRPAINSFLDTLGPIDTFAEQIARGGAL